MAKADDLSTDWQRSAGDFSCSICRRKRLTAQDFSKKQVDKALESLQSIPDKDIRNGQEIKTVLFITAVCKKCMEEKEQKEKEEASARREEREQAIAATELEAPPRVEVTLASRPFGMTPANKGTGYVVLKTSEGKPAIKAGIRPGWRVADVAGQSVEGLEGSEVQALLKDASLPVTVAFDGIPENGDFCIACQEILPQPSFSRKMRTKPPEKRRCANCVDLAEAEAEAEAKAKEEVAGGYADAAAQGPTSKLSELQQLCAETAREAELVTGLKAVRGRGRGRGRR
ncbi:HACE1 [Symbiodinium sp. CCMP2456]|nr:HACE1 [Symbiodinium sp. CCMP2456]